MQTLQHCGSLAGGHLNEDDVVINLDIDAIGAGDGIGLLPVRARGRLKWPEAGAVRAPVNSRVARQQFLQKFEVVHIVRAHCKHHLEEPMHGAAIFSIPDQRTIMAHFFARCLQMPTQQSKSQAWWWDLL